MGVSRGGALDFFRGGRDGSEETLPADTYNVFTLYSQWVPSGEGKVRNDVFFQGTPLEDRWWFWPLRRLIGNGLFNEGLSL